MKRRNILILLISIIVIFFFITFFIFLIQEPKQGYLTDIEKLYSLFTPDMQSRVDSYLNSIVCKPKEYYIENQQVCFVCKKLDTCFGYVRVQREGGKKMNPYGRPSLTGKYDENTAINFYSLGIANSLNCKGKGENWICNKGRELTFKDNTVILTFPQGSDLHQEIEKISKEIGIECEYINFFFSCGAMSLLPIEENKVEVR